MTEVDVLVVVCREHVDEWRNRRLILDATERLGREDLVRHYRRVYHGGGMVLAISGGVERETVRRQVERLFAKLDGDSLSAALQAACSAPPA